MQQAQVNIAPIACTLSDLAAFTTDANTIETILRQDEFLGLRVKVAFGRSGAIALMPLGLTIQVEFFARPIGPGETIELGSTHITTVAEQFTYLPALELPGGPGELGLLPRKFYRISALLQVGASDTPGFINGVIEGLTIQTYVP